MSAVIETSDLSYVYNPGVTALNNINLKVNHGEFVGIIGQNGAGKSTLLKCMTGLLKPTSGRVTINGRDTREAAIAEIAAEVGFVMQNPDRQLFSATVVEEISFGPKNLGLDPEEVAARVDTAIKCVGLESRTGEFPLALSKGERAKVVIASVLAMGPRVIILDEPTSGQDHRGICQIMNIVGKLHQTGHTVIMVTHQMNLVAEYTQRTIVLGKGQIIMDGRTREVFGREETLRQTSVTPPQVTRLGFNLSPYLGLDQTVLKVSELGDAITAKIERKRFSA